jgi:signal transduction histidine kinase
MEVKIIVSPKLAHINLPVENKRSIYLFCKEAINNAVKYSNADLLEISMQESDNKKIEILVSDNGKGFDTAIMKNGNGLINMQQRVIDMGGEYLLNSSPGHGTKIGLNLKIT